MRLDQLLCARGLFASREQAKRAVMAGLVKVEGRLVDKAGTPVSETARIEIEGPASPYVSRGGDKLAGALEAFGVDPEDADCLDVGASTGGFTDCLLQNGARRVVALDVGYGLLDDRLRHDERVVVLERCNARHLGDQDLPGPFDLITVDVSFISLRKVVPALLPHLRPGGALLALVKPQFEAGRGQVGKGGIVRDEELRRRVIDDCARALAGLGLDLVGVSDSVLAGAKGNREAFALLRKPEDAAATRDDTSGSEAQRARDSRQSARPGRREAPLETPCLDEDRSAVSATASASTSSEAEEEGRR